MKYYRKNRIAAFCLMGVLAAPGAALAAADKAEVTLMSPSGEARGTVELTQQKTGVLLTARLDGLAEGEHAFHVHAKGRCAPDFKAAGGHFNPDGASHGFNSADGPHKGDLPNIYVPATAELTFDAFLDGVSLSDGAHPLLDADGAAIVIHEGGDDYETDPAGDAGSRVACGVITAR